ncbi:hypothetical protein KQX54_013662 [Cotesia glomerata]|uniref:Uncharacterized protein n=1 Tax=Cotesia glomerata TaxID=32391 RepID=A0AAV7HX40_COTGL|nr:hypothetical protein KQX54_013662 [Cotesia glomerata]
MWRISKKIKTRREGRQRPEAAQVNIRRVRPGINSGAVQSAILTGPPSEAALTPRASALSRLGPLIPSYYPVPAAIPSAEDRAGAGVPVASTSATADSALSASRRADVVVSDVRVSTAPATIPSVLDRLGAPGAGDEPKDNYNGKRSVSDRARPKRANRSCGRGRKRAWRRATTEDERKQHKEPGPLEQMTFGVQAARMEMRSETSPTPVRVSISLTSIKTPPPVSSPGLGPAPITPRPTSAVAGPSCRPDTSVQPAAEIRGDGKIPGHIPDVSKGAIPRRPPTTANQPAKSTTYVKTRVFTRSLPPATTPRRSSVLPAPAPARTTPAATAELTTMELEEAAALPTRSQHAADTQVVSTFTFKLSECPPHLTPAFAAYKASL